MMTTQNEAALENARRHYREVRATTLAESGLGRDDFDSLAKGFAHEIADGEPYTPGCWTQAADMAACELLGEATFVRLFR